MYHLTDDGPKPCKAHVRACPIGGSHFASRDEAEQAYEQSQGGSFPKPTPPHVKEAERTIKQMEADLLLRDERQFVDTISAQLAREGISNDDIDGLMKLDLGTREASIGFLSVNDNDDRVLGITYSGDFRYEEESGLAGISQKLVNGELSADAVQYEDRDGVGVLSIVHKDHMYGAEGKEKNIDAAVQRLSDYRPSDQFEAYWRLQRLSMNELRERARGKVKPMPAKKDELVKTVLNLENPRTEPDHPQGEFHDGRVLAIASKEPAMKALMAKTVDSHRTGHLRVGSSDNPFSRGVLFYDERDVSRSATIDAVRETVALRAADAAAETVAAKLKNQGDLYAIESSMDDVDADVSTARYFINYYPRTRGEGVSPTGGVYGWFTHGELEQIADNDFTPFKRD